MLPSRQRLSTRQFNTVIEKGRVVHSPLFIMRVLNIDGSTKISAVAPNKIAKTAVGRNRLRRIMYKAIRPLLSNTKSGLEVIVIAKQPAAQALYESIETGMKELFVKAGILK